MFCFLIVKRGVIERAYRADRYGLFERTHSGVRGGGLPKSRSIPKRARLHVVCEEKVQRLLMCFEATCSGTWKVTRTPFRDLVSK